MVSFSCCRNYLRGVFDFVAHNNKGPTCHDCLLCWWIVAGCEQLEIAPANLRLDSSARRYLAALSAKNFEFLQFHKDG